MEPHFRAYRQQSLDDRISNTSECLLCRQQADREMEFVYYIESTRFSRWISLHEKCYRHALRTARQTSWASFAVAFLMLSWAAGLFFGGGDILRIPVWLILINLVASGLSAYSVNLFLSVKLECQLRDKVDQKNRYEDFEP